MNKVRTLLTTDATAHVFERGNGTVRPQRVDLNSNRMRSYASAANNRPQEGKRNSTRANPNEGEQEGRSGKKHEQLKDDLIEKLQMQVEDLTR